MQTVAGVYSTLQSANRALAQLRASGIPDHDVSLVAPGSEAKLEEIPTTDAEQPGVAPALGGVVGGAMGIAGGASLGAAAAAFMVPSVGPILATSLFGAALLGATGAVAGAGIGDALEKSLTEGLPKDELFVYQDALRQGRTLVMVLAPNDQTAQLARRILTDSGAETVDPARHKASVGLRDAAEEKYR